MSPIEPAGEKIARNLQRAIERLQDDIARVELWAGALGCFTKPIPEYGYGQTKFDLPAVDTTAQSKSSGDMTGGRNATFKTGSRGRNSSAGSAAEH